MSGNFSLRPAEPRDLEQIGVIGPAIYAASYGSMWDDAAAYAKQLETFGSAATRQFMARTDTAVWAAVSRERVVGFLTLILNSPDPIEGRPGGAEVPRIYLVAPAQGHGLARALLAQAEAYARSKGMDHLWLDAMLEAPWAWKAYEKWGFKQIGRKAFGKGVMPAFDQMVVLRREIE